MIKIGNFELILLMTALITSSYIFTMLLEKQFQRGLQKMSNTQGFAEFQIRNGDREGQICYAKFNNFMNSEIVDCYTIDEDNTLTKHKYMRGNLKVVNTHSEFSVEE